MVPFFFGRVENPAHLSHYFAVLRTYSDHVGQSQEQSRFFLFSSLFAVTQSPFVCDVVRNLNPQMHDESTTCSPLAHHDEHVKAG